MSDSNSPTGATLGHKKPNHSNAALVLGLATLIATAVLSYLCHFPPAPLASDVDPDIFSAMRADQYLKVLVGDGIPHPAGSEQNKIVRQRVVEILRTAGYEPELQSTSALPVVRRVEQVEITNVIARLPGNGKFSTNPRHAIALVAHFDSHPAGPGASDDGVGTAALLEIARMLKQQTKGEKFDRDIIFLITDGEEYGLLGAKKFIDEHPLASQIAAVVNIEARGSTGASLMFQTGSDSRWLVQTFAQNCQRPRTSSLFYEVYRRMPNDTDFSIFDRARIQGYNFAFIGDVKHYHTPEDNYENASRGSLQHHGQNALGLVRSLANLDIELQPHGRAVYFDIVGRKIIWWPEQWSIVMSLFAAAFFLAVCGIWIRRKKTTIQGVLFGTGIVMLIIVLIIGVGTLVSLGLTADPRFERAWPDSPLPIAIAFWLLGVAVAGIVAALVESRRIFVRVWLGVMFVWVALSIASSLMLNGGSYLFIVPALAVCTTGLLTTFGKQRSMSRLHFASIILSLLIVGLIWFPIDFLFYDAIGFKSYLLPVIRAGLVVSILLPLFFAATPGFRMFTSGVFFGATVISLVVAVFTNS